MTTVDTDPLGNVTETTGGARCGGHGARTYHASAAAVRACYARGVERAEAAERVTAWLASHEGPRGPLQPASH